MNNSIFSGKERLDEVSIGVRLQKRAVEQIAKIAQKNDISKANVVRIIIDDWFKKNGFEI